jgi:hypothetical protein
VKLLLDEAGSAQARQVWREAPSRASSVALLAESRAALAAAGRGGRIDDLGHAEALATFERLWTEMEGIVLTESLARRAGELADVCALRGYDAIHLASAEAILDPGSVMVVSDSRLAESAAALGIEALVPAES